MTARRILDSTPRPTRDYVAEAGARARDAQASTRATNLLVELDRDRVRELQRRGFDLVDGSLTHRGQAIAPAAVVTRDLPELEGEDLSAMRGSLRPGYDAAFAAWVRALPRYARHGDRAAQAALESLRPHERNALSEGVATAGGFTVPATSLLAFNNARSQASTMRAAGARVIDVASDSLELPRLAPNATTTYGSSFTGAWQPEVPTNVFDTSTTMQQVGIGVRKVVAAMRLSRDLADDAPGLLDFLAAEAGLTVGALEDMGFWNGSGVNGEPLGIAHQVSVTDDIEGSTANTISSTSGAQGGVTKLIDMQASLPQPYQRDAEWFCRPSVAASIRKLVGADSSYIWPATATDFYAHPVVLTDGLEAEGANARRVLAYGSIAGGVVIAQRLGVSIDVDPSPFRATGELALVVKTRVGVGLLHPQALRVGVV